jgi:hypothetical protein
MEMRNPHTILVGNLKLRNHLGDLKADGRTIKIRA